MQKKGLFIVLLTFCLTATLFVVFPTRSATNPYDPWLDYNEDGTINMRDIQAGILAFNTYGNTTKNVNVTNLPIDGEGNLMVNQADKPLQVHRDSVEIAAYDFVYDVDGTGYGTLIRDFDSGINATLDMPYCFNPKGIFVNATSIWVKVIAWMYPDMIKVKFDLTWNGLTTMTSDEQWYLGLGSAPVGGGSFITQHNVHIEDENVYASITPGINTLALSHPAYSYQNNPWKSDISMHIYKVVIAIEYEYLG